MKVDFEIKGLKWAVDAELPKPLLDLIKAVAEAAKQDLPAVVRAGLAKAKEEIERPR